MPAIYKSIISILLVDKKHFIIIFSIDFNLYIVYCRARFVYRLVVNDKDIKIVNKTCYIYKRMDKAVSKSKITSIYSNNVFAEMYSAMICKIYTLLYDIEPSTKLLKAFCYRQSRIYGDDIDTAKYLPFNQVEILLLGALKEQLYICTKLVKNRSITSISIIIRLSLTG